MMKPDSPVDAPSVSRYDSSDLSPLAKPGRLARAWYGAGITEFLAADPNAIVGELSRHSDFSVDQTQIGAWLAEIDVMKSALNQLTAGSDLLDSASCDFQNGAVFFEFVIPRMGRRIDVVLIMGPIVFAIEFKAGDSKFQLSGVEQVWDYALDLKNFHETSHDAAIVPMLVAMGAESAPEPEFVMDADKVFRPIRVTVGDVATVISHGLAHVSVAALDTEAWLRGSYRPTPTIVEAARALYAQHSVDAIARHDAGAKNLGVTSQRIEELIDEARNDRRKVICFVTGVPGAGKTLVGLNVATQRRDEEAPTHAVFLSGNGPLVAVLREALTRDEHQRQKQLGNKITKGRVGESVKAFIQNVHHFRDEALRDDAPPADHVVIFDEAQRAWNLQQTRNFMQRKKNQPGFNMSEPQFLISYMDRHTDWAFIVCLVGGGQEINNGEAGIGAWLSAAAEHFPHWELVISDKLTDSEYAAAEALVAGGSGGRIVSDDAGEGGSGVTPLNRPVIRFDDRLHLAVSMRSFRAENVSNFVKQLLDLNLEAAREQLRELQAKYPIRITRDLDVAKRWLRQQARGSERFGLVASSKAMRLKPHAIFIGTNNDVVNPVHWFLNERVDVRSSYYLEDAATEFQVQGLELDWVCLSWDADLRLNRPATAGERGWSFHDFKGSKWQNIKSEDRRRYTLNAYRVLLTRARQGMVIFVPPGDASDHTRPPEYYDETYGFLRDVGVEVV